MKCYITFTIIQAVAALFFIGCKSPAIQTGGSVNIVNTAPADNPAPLSPQLLADSPATNSLAAHSRHQLTTGHLSTITVANHGGAATSTGDHSPADSKGSDTEFTAQISRLKYIGIGMAIMVGVVALWYFGHTAAIVAIKAGISALKV